VKRPAKRKPLKRQRVKGQRKRRRRRRREKKDIVLVASIKIALEETSHGKVISDKLGQKLTLQSSLHSFSRTKLRTFKSLGHQSIN
jgi:hypothetical protein